MNSFIKKIVFVLGSPILKIHQTVYRLRSICMNIKLGGGNRNVQWPFCVCGIENIRMADNVSIGPGSTIYSTIAKLIIHEHVVMGPNVTIITGDHKHIVGRFVDTVKSEEKEPFYDQDVEIESDVWIGCNVTILKGVKISKGSIVAAGAVVTKSFEPYSIIGGVPANVIGKVYSEEEIIMHEQILYNK